MILVGEVATVDGLTAAPPRLGPAGRSGIPTLIREGYFTPAANFRRVQPASVPVDLDHEGRAVGRLCHLERRPDGPLVAVVECDDTFDPIGCQMSGEILSTVDGLVRTDCELRAIAIVQHSATVGKGRVSYIPGRLDERNAYSNWHSGTPAVELLRRALAADSRRGRGEPIEIHDPSPPERRAAGQLLSTTEQPTNVWADLAERRFLARLPNDHDTRPRLIYGNDPVGVLDPGAQTPHGLKAFRLNRTERAAEALQLVAEGILDVATPRRIPGQPWRTAALR